MFSVAYSAILMLRVLLTYLYSCGVLKSIGMGRGKQHNNNNNKTATLRSELLEYDELKQNKKNKGYIIRSVVKIRTTKQQTARLLCPWFVGVFASKQ